MIENKRFAALITATVFLLILAGCEKAADSTQKAVQDTKEMASDVAEDVKEEVANVIDTPSETVSDVVDEIKDGAGAIAENTTELAADTVEGVKETATELLGTSTETVAGVMDEAISKDDALALAKKSGCLACHKIDDKLVGPAWKDVATRYKDDPQAKSLLIEKVSKGGKGNWTEVTGGAPMPPNSPRVSNEDIDKLVTFVLSL